MAHFAEIGLNNTVLRVIVVSNDECKDQFGNESEVIGAKFCHDLFGGVWLQTSYNGTIRKTMLVLATHTIQPVMRLLHQSHFLHGFWMRPLANGMHQFHIQLMISSTSGMSQQLHGQLLTTKYHAKPNNTH